jgi:precorrin-6A/cobalt-precorrin-6A reductase
VAGPDTDHQDLAHLRTLLPVTLRPVRVLLLGGTGEARALAAALADQGIEAISSLAGRVSNPALPVGPVRIGGFGGPAGLAHYLIDAAITVVVDATHPFAATISANAVLAVGQAGLPLVILRRPGWIAGPDEQWQRVGDIGRAAEVVARTGPGTIFLTTGKRDLAVFAGDDQHDYLVRAVDPPTGAMPPRTTVRLDRGPYRLERERELMLGHGVTVLVTKDSGGSMTSAKLAAARELDIPVVMVDRPPLPERVPVVETVEAAANWVVSSPGSGGV